MSWNAPKTPHLPPSPPSNGDCIPASQALPLPGNPMLKRRLLALALILSTALGTAALLPRNKVAAATLVAEPDKPEADPTSPAAARQAFSEKVSTGYDFHWGREKPFLPSNAATDNGQFIDPRSFQTAEYCGHCHQESHKQWRESAHSNSNRAPWYLKNVGLLNEEKGIERSRHCEGCHDPIALVSGSLTKGAPAKRPYDQDGVTCTVCHSIQKVDARGTGSYTMAVPAVLVDAQGAPITRPVSDIEILTHLDRHSAAVMKPFYRTSEFCASCHKAALPHEINDYKWQRAMSPYDEWQNSSFAGQSPLPFYKKDSVSTCETCHMQREALKGRDPGAKQGQLASHRWLGANSLLPEIYHFDEQGSRIAQYLKNKVLNVDVFAVERADGSLVAPLGTQPFTLAPAERVTVSVVIQNKGAAHSLVPEQRDMYESWVRLRVTDAQGKVLHESGDLKPSGELDPEAHSFTNRLINVKGTLNARHEVWNNRVVAYANTIQSGRSQLIRYQFTLPQAGPVTVTASVQYRRFDQHFIDFGLKNHYVQPVIEMVSTARTLTVGNNPATIPAAPADAKPDPASDLNPEWMRWNNYGIALLDAQQYSASHAAFEHVAKLRPTYADAFTNMAIAQIAWEKYADAAPSLEHALQLAPNNARALYYRALIERNAGEVEAAITDLRSVAKQFPRSRDAHRELGFSYYQQHKYPEARAEYEAVQAIDPDDLAAHYNLAILYRRMGLKPEATAQAAYFADQKDDPTASVYALEYLRKHPELSNESVTWHAHDLDHKGHTEAKQDLPTTFTNNSQ